ncbi:MAG: ABC transporter substrate-binding protein [Acidimicrobiia bacterium]|nr:ABC transporter substrate-binding protein [Acidimicrobiia bacterium]
MRTPPRLRGLGAAVLVTGLLAAACGGDPEPTSGGPPTTAAEQTRAPEDAVAPEAASGPDASAVTPAEAPIDTGGATADELAEPETLPAPPVASPAATDGPGESATETGDAGEPAAGFYEDPRGGVFVEFQRGFDRGHPFATLGAFCLPHEPPPEPRRATDSGIGADSITLVHMRALVEELVGLGLGVDVGDPTDMFETLTRIVNERCGGVRGRLIDLRLVEVTLLGTGGSDIDTLRNAACIEATENHDGVIAMNTTTFAGTAQLCITEEHDSVLIGHDPQTREYLERGGGRLLTTSTTLEEILMSLARYVVDTGALAGRRVGVVAPNTPGEAEAVEASLVQVLREAGADVAAFDVLDCAGTSICAGGMAESVQRMADEGVDVLFPLLNPVSLPGYITEMVAQGFTPGDVQFYNSDFNSQGNEVVGDLILSFGGPAAGELYDGATLLVTTDQGRFRLDSYQPDAFGEMCMREYRENSPLGVDYDPRDPDETNKYGMLGLVCSVYRVALRGIYDAGPNPSRADVVAALANLGPVDLPFMLPASLAPGKRAMVDSLLPVTFRHPCPTEGAGTRNDICLVPSDYSELRLKSR